MKIKYDNIKHYKYRILEGFQLQTEIIPPKAIKSNFSSLSENGLLRIEKGFCIDGATGGLDTEDVMRGAVIHDAFCNWQHQGLLDVEHRKEVDKLFRKTLLEDGVSDFRAGYMYAAIKTYVEMRYN
ncbi:MAG: DUF1353 domain-containing protein [Rickettsiales bacterium]|nr:DUF1353 domain-containing protein [Pseudomonadota bacterium]MDA0966618.1 DUF1353 domain-containing protein [Pseudomonadota bacterium]MDG4543646.1 DUF1353 domain-containing protein [Rickettsiales bacterium]MDG4545793.1 DUF1353 domain-containing protein [Rickettsiales bacterium]MDG4547433.1 DUF1353 domain-containing protein [Rickettsiales bacterium]